MDSKKEIIFQLDKYLKLLFPICRSITGKGNRKTLNILNEITPINIFEIESGKKVSDWKIPDEWEIKEAYIQDIKGNKVVDFSKNNLHVVSYSTSINKFIYWNELEKHLFRHNSIAKAIPYRTTYYKKNWGFCVTHSQYNQLKKNSDKFKVVIDSSLKKGSLTYGECVIKGKSTKEILISCYICHPSMANDSLSGVLITSFLAKYLRTLDLNWSYRIIFVPETIGAIAYCSLNQKLLKKIDIGLVITTAGGKGEIGFKNSWNKNHYINKLARQVLGMNCKSYKEYPFDFHGSDERQYSSPGLRINCISIFKDKYYEYDYYHTSLDDLSFVNADNLYKTFQIYKNLINTLEKQKIYKRYENIGEIMLSKHNLYPNIGGAIAPNNKITDLDKILKFLFMIDGNRTIKDISEEMNISELEINNMIHILKMKNIITEI